MNLLTKVTKMPVVGIDDICNNVSLSDLDFEIPKLFPFYSLMGKILVCIKEIHEKAIKLLS